MDKQDVGNAFMSISIIGFFVGVYYLFYQVIHEDDDNQIVNFTNENV